MECAACRWFALEGFPQLEKRYGDSISLVYRHYPLDQHPSAYGAAVATECAAEQGRFKAFHDSVYSQQKLLGLKSFSVFASESGVPNISKFEACLVDSSKHAAVDADLREAKAIGSTGTPTIVINGWHLPGGANSAKLDTIVEFIRSKRGDERR